MESAHTKSIDDIVGHFKVSIDDGLEAANVDKAREKYGLNGLLIHSYVIQLYQFLHFLKPTSTGKDGIHEKHIELVEKIQAIARKL